MRIELKTRFCAGRHVRISCNEVFITTKYSFATIFTPQPLRAVWVLFSPMVSGWAGGRASGWAGGGKKFVRAVSQTP